MKKMHRAAAAAAAALGMAAPAFAAVTNIHQFHMHASSFAFERGSMNPILKDAATPTPNWYLVVQLSDAGQAELTGTACPDNNLPCWLKWNPTTKNWEEHRQPTFPGSTPCTTCEWYVDTDSRGQWVIAAYVDKVGEDIYLFSFSQDSGGIDFNDRQVATVLSPNQGASDDQFAAVALDDTGCAYVMSVVEWPLQPSGSAHRPTMYHIDLINDRTSVEGTPWVLSLANMVHNEVEGNDGGDVVVTTKIDGTSAAVAIYSDQKDDYYFWKRRHDVHPTDPCANNWYGREKVNPAAFDKISMGGSPAHRVDGHVAMSPDPPLWYAVMKTSVPGGSDKPILVNVRGTASWGEEGDFVDEDIYEIVDRNKTPADMPLGGGMSRPSLWMHAGTIGRVLIAYQDDPNPRNTVVSRIGSIFDADPDNLAELVEWEHGHLISQNLWPRLVFSECEDDTRPDCTQNEQKNGGSYTTSKRGWKGAAWSSVRTGGASNFLMAVDERSIADGDPSEDNYVITAEITGKDWGCDDHYDNDGDGEPDPNDPDDPTYNRDWNDSGCGSGASANAPEDTACSDGIDNDLDTKVDYPTDPNCDSVRDNGEAAPACGLGFEAGLAVILLAGVRVLRRRAPSRGTRSGERPATASSRRC